METEIKPLERMKLRDFQAAHDLTMQIVERSAEFYCGTDFEKNRWYAHLKEVETTNGFTLTSAHGNGKTPAMAVRDYARKISEKRIVIGAYTPKRKELVTPVFYV